MSTTSATAPSALADQATVSKLIKEVVDTFQKIKDRLGEIEEQQTTTEEVNGAMREHKWDLTNVKDRANVDYLKLEDIQACIEAHPGQWSDGIEGYLGKIKMECEACLTNLTPTTPQEDFKHPNNVTAKYVNGFRPNFRMYRSFVEDTLGGGAQAWLMQRRKDKKREDTDEDLYETFTVGLH